MQSDISHLSTMIKSRLSEEDLNFALCNTKDDRQFLVHEDIHGQIFLCNSDLTYQHVSSNLTDIGQELVINIPEYIKKKYSENTHKMFTMLDLGCGDGTALFDLSGALRKEGISNFKLVGLAHMFFHKWQTSVDSVSFILDVENSMERYFKKGEVDFIYSVFCLAHMPYPMQEKCLKQLYEILGPDGEIRINLGDLNKIPPYDNWSKGIGFNFTFKEEEKYKVAILNKKSK